MESTLRVTTKANTYPLENRVSGLAAWETLTVMRTNAQLLMRAIQIELRSEGVTDDQRVWLLETRNKAANVCECVYKAKLALLCSVVISGASQYTAQALETYLEMKAYTYNLVCALTPSMISQVEYSL